MLDLFAPIPLHPYEMVLLRAGFALVLGWDLLATPLPYATQPRPVGLARLVDLTVVVRPRMRRVGTAGAWVALVCYVAGVALPLVVPCLFLYLVARHTLRNSQGAIQHDRQAIGLILGVQSVIYVIGYVQASFAWSAFLVSESAYDAWVVFGSQQALVAVYVTSALTKLHRSGWDWFRRAHWIGLQVVKSSRQKYHDGLDAAYLQRAEGILGLVQRHPGLTRVAMGGGLLLELLAPLMLYSRVTNVAGGALLILFHRLNGRFMGLKFREHQVLLAVFFLNAPYAVARLITFTGLGS